MKDTLFECLDMEVRSEDKDGKPIMVSPEFIIKVQTKTEEGIHCIVRPLKYRGATVDLLVTPESIGYLN